jgi:hypothetical protein
MVKCVHKNKKLMDDETNIRGQWSDVVKEELILPLFFGNI